MADLGDIYVVPPGVTDAAARLTEPVKHARLRVTG
jgi:hypothetical protein